jgi:uncharacterized protein
LEQGVLVRLKPVAVVRTLALSLAVATSAWADNVPQTLPFSQNWTNIGLITANNNWSGVPGIQGFRGDDITTATGVDPQTLLAADDPGVINVTANQTNPDTFNTGGVAEFHIANPTISVTGSGTGDAPYVKLYLNTTGVTGVSVAYNLRDIEASTDNAVQPVALHFRVGNSGSFTNVPAAFVADATTGPSQATLVTSVCAVLPVAAENQPLVEVRVMTTNAVGNDENVGIDDIVVSTAPCGGGGVSLTVGDVTLAEGNTGNTAFNFAVTLSGPAPANVTFDAASADGTATLANNDYVQLPVTPFTILAGQSGTTVTVNVVGDTTTEPNETFSLLLTNVVGATPLDTTGTGNIANDDVTVIPVHDIQGNGAASPLVGNVVTTSGIVTGVRSNGFFLQAPDAEADPDPNTSEGVFVFTSAAPPPAAALGNSVQVTATVSEFVPTQDPLQPPLTELTSPSVVLIAPLQPLPAAIPITSASLPTNGTIEQLERLEGMRVSVASMTVVAPTLGNVNEPNATATSTGVFVGVLPPTGRPFREAGIRANDPPPAGSGVTIPPVPRFDGNPERLRVDSDGLVGGPLIDVAFGATVSNLVGPLDYSFRTYTVLPDPASPPVVAGGNSTTVVSAPTNMEFTVASYNLERFFDTVNDPGIGEPVLTPAAFANRLNKASLAIRNHLLSPDVLGIVEMENLSTLQALAAKISADAIAASQPDPQYQAFLVEGNDIGGIDVGFLVKSSPVDGGTPRVTVNEVVQENAGELFVNPDTSTELLNDRPTLRLDAVIHHPNSASFPVTVMVNHLRSLNGVDDESPGSNGWLTAGARVRAKRRAQAESLADLVQDRQVADPQENIVLVGDFNAFEFNDGLVDSMGTIEGTPTPATQVVLASADLVNPDLVNLLPSPASERYSFSFDGNAQTLDHVLVNGAMMLATTAQRTEHARIGADFPQTARNDPNVATRISDHDPIVAYFTVATFPVELQSFRVE